jgi:hypothetical protein
VAVPDQLRLLRRRLRRQSGSRDFTDEKPQETFNRHAAFGRQGNHEVVGLIGEFDIEGFHGWFKSGAKKPVWTISARMAESELALGTSPNKRGRSW